jgi:tol-pal system protein YbgF
MKSNHMLRNALLALTASAAVLVSGPARAFADDDARRAILELREQLRQTTEQNQQARLQLADRLEQLNQELIHLRGQVERMRFELDLKNGKGLNDNAPQVGNPQEQAAFDSPMGQFKSGQYKEAAQGFKAFVTNYPNSQLLNDAQFYLGSSQYASKDFNSSIQQLQALVQAHPDYPRAADALLIVAAAQIEQNKMAAARDSLKKIVDAYPDTNAAQTAKERLKLLQ